MKAVVVAAFVLAAGYWLWRRIRSPRPKYPPLVIAPDDPLMRESVEKARATLDEFRRLLAVPRQSASVKFPVATSSGNTEHLWAEVLEQLGNQVKVRLTTPPVSHEGTLDRVYTKSLDEFEDWQVTLPDGHIRGGYSMRVMFIRGREQWGSLPRELEALEEKYESA